MGKRINVYNIFIGMRCSLCLIDISSNASTEFGFGQTLHLRLVCGHFDGLHLPASLFGSLRGTCDRLPRSNRMSRTEMKLAFFVFCNIITGHPD